MRILIAISLSTLLSSCLFDSDIEKGNVVTVHTDTIYYYVITISDNTNQDKPVYGPLSKKSFDSLRRQLTIEDIKFDMLYPEY